MKVKGDVLFTSGQYEVRLGEDNYICINTDTGIVEYKTEVLYECMRMCKMFDNGVHMMLNPPPEWTTTKEKVPVQAELKLN